MVNFMNGFFNSGGFTSLLKCIEEKTLGFDAFLNYITALGQIYVLYYRYFAFYSKFDSFLSDD